MPGDALTSDTYWDAVWAQAAVAAPLSPNTPGLNETLSRAFHELFAKMFSAAGLASHDTIVEIGCGGSRFLPYFAQTWGLEARGIDYSPEGCALTRAIAAKAGVHVDVQQADVFTSSPVRSRMVFSCGLAEHFRPTTLIVTAMRNWCGGYMLTVIPNMNGIVGWLQRKVQPKIFAAHVPMTPQELTLAHEECDLDVLQAGYFMFANFGVVNPTGNRRALAIMRLNGWVSKAIWLIERAGIKLPPNRLTSPYVYVLARIRSAG